MVVHTQELFGPEVHHLVSRCVLHVCPSLIQYLHLGRKWALMSSKTTAASSTLISSACAVLSGLAGSALKFPSTSSLDPQGRLLMSATKFSMVKAPLGEI